MNKFVRRFLAVTLSITIIMCSPALASTTSTVSNSVEESVLTTTNRFFSTYLDSMKSLTYPDFSATVIQNRSTAPYLAAIKYEIDANKIFNTRYSDYSFNIKLHEIAVLTDTVTVNLTLNTEAQYVGHQNTAKTSVDYSLGFECFNNLWKIVYIDTKYIVFDEFINNLNLSAEASTSEISLKASDLSRKCLGNLSNLSSIQSGILSSSESQRLLTDRSAQNNLSLGNTSSITSTSVAFDYHIAAAYAEEYATNENPLFYIASEDCTNFISQCVWAGYGGESGNNVSANISNHFRMYYPTNASYTNGWFAGAYGGSATWEQVTDHYDFVTSNTSIGPRGTGYNNGSLYNNIHASTLYRGDVLQLRNGASGEYRHSIIVSDLASTNPTSFSEIYCCAHNSNHYRTPLTVLIAAFGLSTCYMRVITYSAASFSS